MPHVVMVHTSKYRPPKKNLTLREEEPTDQPLVRYFDAGAPLPDSDSE